MLLDNLEGWDGVGWELDEGVEIRIPMVDSC